jgi:PAS domain S-box-containing protein
LEERERHSQSLLRLSRSLEGAQTYADVLRAARDEVTKIVGYQNLWAYLFTEDKKFAHAIFAGGPIEDMVMSDAGTATLTITGDRMLEEISSSKEIVVVDDAQTDDRVNREIVARLGNRTIINVPIILFDRHLGSVGTGTFGDEGTRIPTATEKEYLIALASHMAVSLDRIHLLEKRRQIEGDLLKRERESRLLLENIPDLIVRYDKDLQRVYVNPAWESASGLSAGEVLNIRAADIPKVPSPTNEEYLGKLQLALSTGISQSAEFTWVNAAGRALALDYIIVPERDQSGDLCGVLCVGRDITERKDAEQALQKSNDLLRAVIEAAPTAIIGLDLDGKVRTVWNPAAEKMFGWTMDEVIGEFLPTVPFEKEEEFKQFRDWIRSGKTLNGVEVRRKRRDGTPVDYSIYASPLHDSEGRIVGNVAVLADISERKRAEEALARRTQQLEILARATQQVNSVLKTDDVLRSLIKAAMELTRCSGGAAGLVIEGRMVFSEYNKQDTLIPINFVFEKGQGVPGWIMTTQEPYLSNDAENDPHVVPEIQKELGFYNLVDIPIMSRTG